VGRLPAHPVEQQEHTEWEQEEQTAHALGFHYAEAHETECSMLLPGADEELYAQARPMSAWLCGGVSVEAHPLLCAALGDARSLRSEPGCAQARNYVLTRWREDVSRSVSSHADGHAPQCKRRCVLPHHCAASSRVPRGRYLTEGAAAAGARAGYREYARAAWRFLNSHGYINFGVSPELIARSLAAPADKGHVIVVGAGLAGARALGPAGRPRRRRPSHARTALAHPARLNGAARLQAWERRGSCACLATA